MVAPNTQVSPLKHHMKGSNTFTSFRNYSRIQSEVQREGSEIHKENLLSVSLSNNGKHFGDGGKANVIASSVSQQGGHVHIQAAASKTGLPVVLSMEMGHGSSAQEHGNDTYHMDSRVSHDVTRCVAPGTAEIPRISEPLAMSAARPSLTQGEGVINAYSLYAEMFPRAYTPISTCTPISDMHREQECCPSKPMLAEHMKVVQFLSDVRHVEDDREEDVKRLKHSSNMEAKPVGFFDIQSSEQGNASCYAVQGSKVSTTIDGARQGGMGEVCSFTCTYKRHGRAACVTSLTEDMSKPLPAGGLKPFTASAHAQMPKAMLTFSEGEPSLPLSLEHFQQQASNRLQKTSLHESSCTDADWGKFLALSATPAANDVETACVAVLPFQHRFKQLQNFLKQCDDTDKNECIQALRSLSAAARSGHAVELETRAIRLSLEEGKEIKRMKLLNVLGKMSDRSLDDVGATPHGPRLPAPGVTVKLKSVP